MIVRITFTIVTRLERNVLWYTKTLHYNTSVESYIDHCVIHDHDASFLVTISKLIDWLKHLETRRLDYEILKKYLCDVRSHHVDMSYSLQETKIFVHSLLKRICQDARRRMRKTNRRERRSITKDLLFRLLKRLNTNTFDDDNMHVAFCLTFANFFRVNEFIYIKVDAQTNDFDEWHVIRNHVTMSDDCLTLIISFFKIDSFKKRIAILIAIIDDVACFLRSLRHLYASFSIKNNTFLF